MHEAVVITLDNSVVERPLMVQQVVGSIPHVEHISRSTRFSATSVMKPWYVLYCLCNCTHYYKICLAANREEVALTRYLSGPFIYMFDAI